MKPLLLEKIPDTYARENFQRIQDGLREQALLKGKWAFFELVFTAAVTNLKYPHHLGFMPKDILQTSLTGSGSLVWNYSSFDTVNLDITTTGPCTVRAFIGTYAEGSPA